jgi:hypothetical protein
MTIMYIVVEDTNIKPFAINPYLGGADLANMVVKSPSECVWMVPGTESEEG